MTTRQHIRRLVDLTLLLGVVTLAASMSGSLASVLGQQAPENEQLVGRLTLVPDAPHWARRASTSVMIRSTYQWRAMQKNLAASAQPFLQSLPETATVFGPVAFNRDPSALPQNEATIIEDPTGGGRIVAGYNDDRALVLASGDFTGWSISTNGAASVAKDGQLQSVAILGTLEPSAGDPVLASDRSGNFFMGSLAFAAANGPNGVAVYRSPRDGSLTGLFSAACTGGDGNRNCWPTSRVIIAENCTTSGGHFYDKDWIAVDRSSSLAAGAVYVTWTKFGCASTDFSTAIQISKCINTLASCTAPMTLDFTTGTGSLLDYLQFSYVTVGSNGVVYVIWVRHDGNSPNGETATIEFRSIAPTSLTTSVGTVGALHSVFVENSPIVQNTSPFPADYPVSTIPVMAQSGRNLIVAWSRRTPGTPVLQDTVFLDSDLVSSISSNGGSSWSTTPIVISNAPKAQYMPSICVNYLGEVEVAYYSNELDPTLGFLQNVFLRTSRTGGSTYNAPIRVTPSSNLPQLNPVLGDTFIGDYTGISCLGADAYVHYTANYLAKETAELGGSATLTVRQQDTFVTKVANP